MKSNANIHRNKGLEYLHSMKPIFHEKWAPANHGLKMTEFYNFFRPSDMSIATYTNKFRRQLRELSYNGVNISPDSASKQYILGLGSEFIPIRNMSVLPSDFLTTDLDKLAEAARTHLRRVLGNRALQKQQQALLRQNSTNTDGVKSNSNIQSPNDQPQPSENPKITVSLNTSMLDFQKEIMHEIGFHCHTKERKNFWQSLTQPNFCYFYRTANHTSANCTRMNCASAAAASGTAPSSPFVPNRKFTSNHPEHETASTPTQTKVQSSTPVARVVRAEIDEDTFSNLEYINKTNYDADYYSKSTNNYSRHALNSSESTIFVVDSGASEHMCNNKHLFISMQNRDPTKYFVRLGDGKQTCPIHGVGTIQYEIKHNIIVLHGVLYVPDLDVSLYSIKLHMKFQGCYEHSENNKCTIAYPTFSIDAITKNEITFAVQKPVLPANKPSFDNSTSTMIINNQRIPYNFTTANHPTTVQISSTFKTKPIKYIPTKSTPDSAGYDLVSIMNTSIAPQSRKAIGLGFSIEIPPGLYGRFAPRSGLALKNRP